MHERMKNIQMIFNTDPIHHFHPCIGLERREHVDLKWVLNKEGEIVYLCFILLKHI